MGRWAIINGLLVILVLLLGLQIGRIWSRALPAVEVVPRAAGGPTPKSEGGKGKRGEKAAAAKAAEATPAVMVAAIVDRDLFDPSRSKPTEQQAAPVAAAAVPPPQNVQISGVRVLGKDREAFLIDGGQSRRVRVGDQVQGYIIKTIRTSEIVMASPSGEPVSLSLAVEKGKGAAPGARPPTLPKPGQPGAPGVPGGPGSPAAGPQAANSPAAGIQPPKPAPPRPGMPPVPGAAPGVQPVQPVPVPPVPGTVPPGPGNPNVQLPNQVRDSLERFKEQQRERREMGK
jgi:hypothetical protein